MPKKRMKNAPLMALRPSKRARVPSHTHSRWPIIEAILQRTRAWVAERDAMIAGVRLADDLPVMIKVGVPRSRGKTRLNY